MSGGEEPASIAGDGMTTCGHCGAAYHKASAKFCSRCGASRDVKSSNEGKAKQPKINDAGAVGAAVAAGGSSVIAGADVSTATTPPTTMPPLFPSPRMEPHLVASLDGGSNTLRPFDVALLQHKKKSSTAAGEATATAAPSLEFRDPSAATSLTSPKKHAAAEVDAAPVASSSSSSAPSGLPSTSLRPNGAHSNGHKSGIYVRDDTLPELPPHSLADPRRHPRTQSESSEEAEEAQFASAAVDTHATSSKASGGARTARAPVPPREQPPSHGGRPSSASSLTSGTRQGRRTSSRLTSAVEDASAFVDGGKSTAVVGKKTVNSSDAEEEGEEEEHPTGSLHPSAEEEAQYTAWATLPPDGLTPEMLQTSNAAELRKWRKGSLIGRGTYGSVYLGLLPDGSFYAVKSVELGNKKAAADHLGIQELVSLSREINMMHRLRHRNLCTFKGVYYDAENSSICMFMEYIGGGSLSSLVKRFKPLPPSVVRSWTLQLLSGLQYLHAQHIIHRDIKGDNVLVDTTAAPATLSQIKLVDFGAARRLTDAVSQSSTVIGTPYWMAPEVVDASGDGGGYSYKADVWSVGCTVAEMLTGRPPWPCKTSAPAAIMMIASATGMPTEIPEKEATPGCLYFMKQCFIRDPEQRPTVQMLLQHPWIKGKME